MINYDDIVHRIKTVGKIQTNKEIAALFGLSAPDFSRRKKRKTLLGPVVAWALENGISLDWLLTGRQPGQSEELGENIAAYARLDVPLLIGVIQAVDKSLRAMEKGIDPLKKAEIIALLYEAHAGTQKDILPETVERYLRVAM